jgi:hypothetical protein
MFRDDPQAVSALRLLLATVKLDRLWTSLHGPTIEACELLVADGGCLSSGERVMLLSAWAIWNGKGGVTVAELGALDQEPKEAVCSLIVASGQGSDAVHAWIGARSPPGRRRVVKEGVARPGLYGTAHDLEQADGMRWSLHLGDYDGQRVRVTVDVLGPASVNESGPRKGKG